MSTNIEKLRKRDVLLREIAERKRLRQSELDMENIRKLITQRKNVRLVKKIFVDLYEKQIEQITLPFNQGE